MVRGRAVLGLLADSHAAPTSPYGPSVVVVVRFRFSLSLDIHPPPFPLYRTHGRLGRGTGSGAGSDEDEGDDVVLDCGYTAREVSEWSLRVTALDLESRLRDEVGRACVDVRWWRHVRMRWRSMRLSMSLHFNNSVTHRRPTSAWRRLPGAAYWLTALFTARRAPSPHSTPITTNRYDIYLCTIVVRVLRLDSRIDTPPSGFLRSCFRSAGQGTGDAAFGGT